LLTTAYEKMDGHYGRWAVVREIDETALNRARDIFESYKERGVILNDSFDDPAWTLSNQTQNVGLTLVPFEGYFHKSAMEWIGCNYRCYQNCVKVYIALNLGEIGLSTLRELSKTLITLAGKTSEEAVAANEYINHIVGLLQIVPGGGEERDYVIETLEERAERHLNNCKGKQRRLADFNTYLKFNETLAVFWNTAGERQKSFYFPLYFWWKFTSVLPLRPTEFLLTPRNCLQNGGNDEAILTIRRTKLKGGLEKIAYRIADDYERKQYVIPGSLADEVRKYLNATAKMRPMGIDTLFLHEPHCNYIGISQKLSSKYYSYACLKTCLRYFYDEVVDGGIARVQLGDTRHIAMASLIISGGSPVVCRELAGHSDIDISSHYFSNISNLVECVTLARYRKSKGGDADISGDSKYPLTLPENRSRVSGGWCDAPEVAAGDISECLKVAGIQGNIGDCAYCEHYFPDEPGIRFNFLDAASGKQRVDADSQYLIRMIELVRKGLGYKEDIGAALLRLQRSSDHYGKCLWEKYSKKGGI
jgi:hypothetical protein